MVFFAAVVVAFGTGPFDIHPACVSGEGHTQSSVSCIRVLHVACHVAKVGCMSVVGLPRCGQGVAKRGGVELPV